MRRGAGDGLVQTRRVRRPKIRSMFSSFRFLHMKVNSKAPYHDIEGASRKPELKRDWTADVFIAP
jgi:hypothetical protein